MFDLVVTGLNVAQSLRQVRPEIVQRLQVLLALVDELLSADGEEAQVGLMGHHVMDHLSAVLFAGLQLTEVGESLFIGQLTLSARQPRLRRTGRETVTFDTQRTQ